MWRQKDNTTASHMYTLVAESNWENDLAGGTVSEYDIQGIFVEPGDLFGKSVGHRNLMEGVGTSTVFFWWQVDTFKLLLLPGGRAPLIFCSDRRARISGPRA